MIVLYTTSMMSCSYLCLLLAWISTASGSVGCGPRTGIGQIISQNVTLLHNITASSELFVSSSLGSFLYSADRIINYGLHEADVWCSTEADPSPRIEMIFTEPVVITGLLSGGYSSGATLNYVDNFTVEYAPSEDSDFVLYRVIGEDSETQSFITVPMINTFTPLEEPIEAQKLRFSVNGNFVNFATSATCLTVAFFGCLSSEESTSTTPVYKPTTTTMQSPSEGLEPSSSSPAVVEPSSSSPAVVEPSSTPSGGETEPSSSKETVVEKDFMVLAIVLPIALVTILIVFVIVAVGVCICVRHNKESWSIPSVRYSTVRGVAVDKSELHDAPKLSSDDSRQRADTLVEVENVLYETDSRPAYSTEVTYESVGSSGQIDNGGGEQSHQYSVPSHTARDRVLTNANESYNVVSPDHHYALPQAKPPVAAVASPIE